MRRDYELKHQYPTTGDAQHASLDEAFVAGLKPLVKLITRDEQAREVLRLDEEPVREEAA